MGSRGPSSDDVALGATLGSGDDVSTSATVTPHDTNVDDAPISRRRRLAARPPRPFYAMKLVAGMSLEKVLDGRTTLDERLRLVPNLVQLAEAIAYAHGNGVIHPLTFRRPAKP